MNRLTSAAAMTLAAALLVAATATHAFAASTLDKRMVLTFSKPVQVPGTTLPAGKYVFRLADPAYQKVWWVYDSTDRKLLATFFYVPTMRTFEQMRRANNTVVVIMRETPQGVTPAVRNIYYPIERWGNEFVYPKEQARKLAAATNQMILATDTRVKKGGVPTLVFVRPDGTTVAADPGLVAPPPSNTVASTPQDTSGDSQAVGTSGTDEPQPVGINDPDPDK